MLRTFFVSSSDVLLTYCNLPKLGQNTRRVHRKWNALTMVIHGRTFDWEGSEEYGQTDEKIRERKRGVKIKFIEEQSLVGITFLAMRRFRKWNGQKLCFDYPLAYTPSLYLNP